MLAILYCYAKCHKNGTLFICITKEEGTQIFRFDLYLPHLLTCNYTKIRPRTTRHFIGFHSSLMCCTYCASAKDKFSIKMLIASTFVPNLELIGPSSRIKTRNTMFSLKMATDPCLNSPKCKTWTLLLGSFSVHLESLGKENYNMGQYDIDIRFTSSNVSPFLPYNHSL